jgi:hypothetical protein
MAQAVTGGRSGGAHHIAYSVAAAQGPEMGKALSSTTQSATTTERYNNALRAACITFLSLRAVYDAPRLIRSASPPLLPSFERIKSLAEAAKQISRGTARRHSKCHSLPLHATPPRSTPVLRPLCAAVEQTQRACFAFLATSLPHKEAPPSGHAARHHHRCGHRRLLTCVHVRGRRGSRRT